LTATTFDFVARPKFFPTAVAAVWVPCLGNMAHENIGDETDYKSRLYPLSSVDGYPPKVAPHEARPVNSECSRKMPVSGHAVS
jgi:hypothetical protein